MTVRHLFSDVAPALNLDFANTKRLDPRITFTRSSTGTYVDEFGVIKTAASNEARFDHDSDGNSLGLLIEESRTNSVQYSHEFDNSYWIKDNTTITANATVAPDGTNTADKLVGTAVNGLHRIYRNAGLSATNGQPYTASCFLKASERSRCSVSIYDTSYKSVSFDLSAGTITDTGTGATGAITPFNNGWYRCSVTITAAATALEVHFFTLDDDGNGSWLGNGTDGLFSWGAQLEAGSFPTSYIPTSGSTATRSADVASMTGTNFSSWYNQSEGSWYIDYNKKLAPVNIANVGIIGPQHLYYRGNSSEALRRFGSNTPATGIAANQNKVALAYGSSNFDICANGNATVNNYSVATPTGQTTAHIMSDGSNYLTSHISRLTYYDRRLTDAQLQALTL